VERRRGGGEKVLRITPVAPNEGLESRLGTGVTAVDG
jgi:hypothetical protein